MAVKKGEESARIAARRSRLWSLSCSLRGRRGVLFNGFGWSLAPWARGVWLVPDRPCFLRSASFSSLSRSGRFVDPRSLRLSVGCFVVWPVLAVGLVLSFITDVGGDLSTDRSFLVSL